jgi:hypothetical protein
VTDRATRLTPLRWVCLYDHFDRRDSKTRPTLKPLRSLANVARGDVERLAAEGATQRLCHTDDPVLDTGAVELLCNDEHRQMPALASLVDDHEGRRSNAAAHVFKNERVSRARNSGQLDNSVRSVQQRIDRWPVFLRRKTNGWTALHGETKCKHRSNRQLTVSRFSELAATCPSLRRRYERKFGDETTSVTFARTECRDRTAMELDQLAHDRQPEAEPTTRVAHAPGALHEWFKDPRA